MSMYVSFSGLVMSHALTALIVGVGCFAYGYFLGKRG